MDARGVRRAGAGLLAGHPLRIAAAIVLGTAGVAVAIALIVFTFADAAGRVRTRFAEDLVAIGTSRSQLISDWRRERMDDAASVSASVALREEVTHLLAATADGSHTYADIRIMVAHDLAMLKADDAYVATMLLDREGRLLATSSTEHAGVPPTTRDVVRQVVASGAPTIGRPFVVVATGAGAPDGAVPEGRGSKAFMDVVAPVTDDAGDVVAVVVLRLDPQATLFADVLRRLHGPRELPPGSRDGHASLLEVGPTGIVEVSAETAGGVPSGGVDADSPLAAAVSAADDDPHQTYLGNGEEGRPVVADVRRIGDGPWVLVTAEDAATVDAEATQAGAEAFARVLSVVALAVLVLAALFIGRQRRLLKELLRTEQERAIAAGRVDDVVAHARDIVLLLDEDGAILDGNESAVKAYGYDLDTLRTLNLADLRTPAERESIIGDLLGARAPGGVIRQTVHQRRDGSVFPVEVSTHALRGPASLRFETAVRDIGQRVEAEHAMQQQLDELRRWQAGAIGREERILELKAEVNALLEAGGRSARYPSVEQAARVADAR